MYIHVTSLEYGRSCRTAIARVWDLKRRLRTENSLRSRHPNDTDVVKATPTITGRNHVRIKAASAWQLSISSMYRKGQ